MAAYAPPPRPSEKSGYQHALDNRCGAGGTGAEAQEDEQSGDARLIGTSASGNETYRSTDRAKSENKRCLPPAGVSGFEGL